MQEGLEHVLMLMDGGNALKNMFALVALCSARTLAAMLVMPPLSGQRMPGMSRMGLPTWIGLFVAWGQPLATTANLPAAMIAVLMLKETLIGFLMGFAAATIFWVAEGVGSMVDNMAGYNNVQQSNPQSSDQSTPVGSFLSELSMFSFFSLGGMTAFIGALFESYAWWPLDRALPAGGALLEKFAQLQVSAYVTAVARLSAPALLVLVLIDLCFGLLSKTAEKLEPNSMAQPVKGATAMVLLSLIIGVFFQHLRDELSLHDFAAELHRLLGTLAASMP